MTIKEARIKANFTQKNLAELLGISKRSLESWENGIRKPKMGEEYIIECINALSILTNDGLECIKDGTFDIDWVLFQYKKSKVEKISKWGSFGETFNANWNRIPITIKEKLTAEELAELVDIIKNTYDDGCKKGSKG